MDDGWIDTWMDREIDNALIHILLSQEFFVALRLVACAQNGLEVALSSLNLAVPPPRFVRNALKFKFYLIKNK